MVSSVVKVKVRDKDSLRHYDIIMSLPSLCRGLISHLTPLCPVGMLHNALLIQESWLGINIPMSVARCGH